MKNYLRHALVLILIVLLVLLVMKKMPPLKIGSYSLRSVEVLSDICAVKDEVDTVELPLIPVVKPAFVDTCLPGMTCIEDYGDSTKQGMSPFYEAISQLNTLGRPVRIAIFGDSFIEGDIFTSDLREMLQQKFGGCGVGYVDIISPTHGFRPTVRQSFNGWKSYAVNTSGKSFDRSKQGIAGRYFTTSAKSHVELIGQDKYASLADTCQESTIYFYSKGEVELTATINQNESKQFSFESSGGVQTATIKGNVGRVRWVVNRSDSALFYGATMDPLHGVILDNFSLRSSTGTSLQNIPEETLKGFNAVRPYDLIIFQYGLNIATPNGDNYDNYKKRMSATIEHFKKCFPETGFLLFSISDRSFKTSTGEMKTTAGVKNLVRYQQNIAIENGIAYWNLFEAMGGENSMPKLVKKKPSLANLDYVHINFRGGKHLAGLLFDALMYGKEQYDKRIAYENE